MCFNGLDNFGSQRKDCILDVPVLMKQRDDFTDSIENESLQKSSLGDKVG